MKIAIFYHCLFYLGDPPELLPNAYPIVSQQMDALKDSGLFDAASFMLAGVNGGQESAGIAKLIIPANQTVLHGLNCRNECLTLVELEKWLPGHEDWTVLYFHSKGATHPPGSPKDAHSARWRTCMMRHCLWNWRKCVADLEAGYEACGAHWMEPPATPAGHHIFGGNMWWAKASFLATLPSIFMRDRIKQSGIGSLESRYEAEVWLGNGPRPPRVKDYHPHWDPSKIHTCTL